MLDLQISPMLQPRSAPMTSSKSSTRDASRILCLKLQDVPSSFGIKTKKRSAHAIAETFLKFSPRIVYRQGEATSSDHFMWLFIDIASTSHLFNGEEECAREACALAQVLGFGVQYAVSDTPSGAQAFATAHPNTICPAGDERERLKNLSLPLLLHLEGVQAWARPSVIENILTFFLMVGFKKAGDLSKLSEASFRERWGSEGVLLWQRLNALDRSPISPLAPTEPLEDYVHLDFPITLVSLLLRHSEKSLDYLFARLSGRRLFASRLVFTFHCEYSSARHVVVIEPNTPSRNQELFTTLLENRLSSLDLQNPIRDFEVYLVPVEERASQLDFFEPRVTHRDRLETLFSLLMQSSVKPGLFELHEAIMPEDNWQLASDAIVRPEDMTERRLAGRGGARVPAVDRGGASGFLGGRGSLESRGPVGGASLNSRGSANFDARGSLDALGRDSQSARGAQAGRAPTRGSRSRASAQARWPLMAEQQKQARIREESLERQQLALDEVALRTQLGSADSEAGTAHGAPLAATGSSIVGGSMVGSQVAFGGGTFGGTPLGALIDPSREYASAMVAEESIAYVPAYGDHVSQAPRPSRLLTHAVPIPMEELEKMKVLSQAPIERLEEGWWEDENSKMRDYYFAVSPEGQCLWIYQDLATNEYFLHGYFD